MSLQQRSHIAFHVPSSTSTVWTSPRLPSFPLFQRSREQKCWLCLARLTSPSAKWSKYAQNVAIVGMSIQSNSGIEAHSQIYLRRTKIIRAKRRSRVTANEELDHLYLGWWVLYTGSWEWWCYICRDVGQGACVPPSSSPPNQRPAGKAGHEIETVSFGEVTAPVSTFASHWYC